MKHNPRAEHISCQLTHMYDISDEFDKPIVMYSFDSASRSFYQGVITRLLEEGLTEEQVEEVLRSKYMRWMLDDMEDQLAQLGFDSVTDHAIEWGKQ